MASVPVPARGQLALACLAVAFGFLLALAPKSEADFTTAPCLGSDVTGSGASFARGANAAWRSLFEAGFCSGAGRFPLVSYDPSGSAVGRQAMGERLADGPRFGMTVEGPSPASVAQMNEGTPMPGDEGRIQVVPAAVGGVAIVVNFPNGCERELLPDGWETAPRRAGELDAAYNARVRFTNRVRFTRSQLEAIWSGDPAADRWDEIFPTLSSDPECQVPIRRIVRPDVSGTTFTLKDFLDGINPSRNWIETFNDPNTSWPNSATNPTLTGAASGNGALVDTVAGTDSSIGYSDLSTARGAGFAIQPTTVPTERDDDVFWIPVSDRSAVFREPTDCANTVFSGVPSSTLGDWAAVSGVDSPGGYAICTLVYGLLFDNYAEAYGTFSTAVEEPKARTVKDYWTSLLSDAGQSVLSANDYSPLPPAILSIARAGVEAVGWDENAGGGAGSAPAAPPPPPPGDPTSPPPPAASVSNVFSVPSTRVSSRTGRVTLSIRVPGAGVIEVVATAKLPRGSARGRIARARVTARRAGLYRATLKPSAAARKVLRRRGRLNVRVTVTYTPRGGSARSSTRPLTLKLRTRGKR